MGRNKPAQPQPASAIFEKLTAVIGPGKYDPQAAQMVQRIIRRDLRKDRAGNYHLKIGGGNERIVFAAHLDTVERTCVNPTRFIIKAKDVKDSYGDIMVTDGKTILGADDRAGCAILCHMIQRNVPGNYIFFTSEEAGCVGSKALSKDWKLDMDAMIEFDRRGYKSVITHQCGERTCSDKFARALADAFNSVSEIELAPDSTGLYTDSAQFSYLIPECTNISVGYFNPHSGRESQDLDFLDRIAEAAATIDWDTLPIERDPTKVEYKYEKWDGYKSGYYGSYLPAYTGKNGYSGSLSRKLAKIDDDAYLDGDYWTKLQNGIDELSHDDIDACQNAILDMLYDSPRDVIAAVMYTMSGELIYEIKEWEKAEWRKEMLEADDPFDDDAVLADKIFS